jgi:GNAT superfamily N-acetyltransferase
MMTASVPNAAIRIRRLTDPTPAEVQGLADVLLDAVESGASVGFMASLTREAAVAFWTRVADDTRAGRRALLIAEDEINGTPQICGTVHLILDLPPNQPHRADLVKMLVHRRARRRGVGAALMRAAEALARDLSRTLLVLDAVTEGDAARLYERLGWTRVGDIPGYALFPDGRVCGTTYYYKQAGTQAPGHQGIE